MDETAQPEAAQPEVSSETPVVEYQGPARVEEFSNGVVQTDGFGTYHN